MRKTFVILSLVALAWVASANDAFAQRFRGGGGGRGVGVGRGGIGISLGTNYGSSYYDGRYYNDGRGGYYNTPHSGWFGYPSNSYYVDPVEIPTFQPQQSFYSDPNAATVTVILSDPNAQVWFDDAATSQRGMERSFQTAPLTQSGGTYTIKARWTENGRAMDQQRQVQVRPGQSVVVNFRDNPSERLPNPRLPQ